MITMVLGGTRSGKSNYGQKIATDLGEKTGLPITYVATGVRTDDEMARRIEKHQEDRPNDWETEEISNALPEFVTDASGDDRILLIDSVAEWISNELLADWDEDDPLPAEKHAESRIAQLVQELSASKCHVVIVAHEVGQGVVPPFVLGRVFRDINGHMNQELAAACDDVWLSTAGIPVRIK